MTERARRGGARRLPARSPRCCDAGRADRVAGAVTAAAGTLARRSTRSPAGIGRHRADAGAAPGPAPRRAAPHRVELDPAGRGLSREPRDRGRHRRHQGRRRGGGRGRPGAGDGPPADAGRRRRHRGRDRRVVAELADRYDVVAVGVGAAGWIANDRATVLFSPHLAWRDEPLRDALVEPDRHAGHGGERRQRGRLGRVPVRRRARRAGGLPASRSAPGSAAAWWCPGRSTAAPSGWPASGGTCRWCRTAGAAPAATAAAGRCTPVGTALARDARELAEVSPVAAHRLLELAGGDPAALTGTLRHHRRPGRATRRRWRSSPRWGAGWAAGSPAWPRSLDPSVVVIGGGVSEAGDLLLAPGPGGVRRGR